MQAMSLKAGEEAEENSDVRGLCQQLEQTNSLVAHLSKQLQVINFVCVVIEFSFHCLFAVHCYVA